MFASVHVPVMFDVLDRRQSGRRRRRDERRPRTRRARLHRSRVRAQEHSRRQGPQRARTRQRHARTPAPSTDSAFPLASPARRGHDAPHPVDEARAQRHRRAPNDRAGAAGRGAHRPSLAQPSHALPGVDADRLARSRGRPRSRPHPSQGDQPRAHQPERIRRGARRRHGGSDRAPIGRLGRGPRLRRRAGHGRGGRTPRLRAVLHHQAGRPGHRPVDEPRPRDGRPRGHARRRDGARPGRHVF